MGTFTFSFHWNRKSSFKVTNFDANTNVFPHKLFFFTETIKFKHLNQTKFLCDFFLINTPAILFPVPLFQPQEMLSNGNSGMPPYKSERRDSEASLNSSLEACRICHCEAEPGAPLISPCVCSGSLKYVHQACLQQWIKSADTKSCELCKYDFEMTTRIKPFRKVIRLRLRKTIVSKNLLCSGLM